MKNVILYFLFSILFFLLNEKIINSFNNWVLCIIVLFFINLFIGLYFFLKSNNFGKIIILVLYFISEYEIFEFIALATFMLLTKNNFAP